MYSLLIVLSSFSLSLAYGFLQGVPLPIDDTTTESQQERLVLRGVTREDSGKYTCAAANSEGARTSNTLTLTVMCAYTFHIRH